MALKPVLAFTLRVRGDGSDKTVQSAVATGPYGLGPVKILDGAYTLPPAFSLLTTVPTDIKDVASGNNHEVSATISLGVVTFTYADGDMPAADEVDTLYGNLVFG